MTDCRERKKSATFYIDNQSSAGRSESYMNYNSASHVHCKKISNEYLQRQEMTNFYSHQLSKSRQYISGNWFKQKHDIICNMKLINNSTYYSYIEGIQSQNCSLQEALAQ